MAMMKILTVLPLIRSVEAKIMLLKILPVFFSHAEVFTQSLTQAIYIIRVLQCHKLFVKERRLFSGWYIRLVDTYDRLSQRYSHSDQPSQNTAIPSKISRVHEFMILPGTDFVDPIGYAELDFFNSFLRFLKYHKLHKYLYFFANLSSIEILNIDESNILEFENKVGIFPMTTGARRAILRRLGELNNRSSRLITINEMISFSDPNNMEELLEEVKTILRTPIRGCIIKTSNDDLPDLLTEVSETMFREIMKYLKKRDRRILPVVTQFIFLLKRAWSCYFFSNEQKLLFNEWRWDITTLREDFYQHRHQKPLVQVQVQKPKQEQTKPRKTERELLDDLIFYMENWLTTKC